jgi:hypothetical protein
MFSLKKLLINHQLNESANRSDESGSEESISEYIDQNKVLCVQPSDQDQDQNKFTEKIVDVVNSYINHFSKFKESTYIIDGTDSSSIIKAIIKNTEIFYVLRIENYLITKNAPKNWKNIENGHNYQVFLIPNN